MSVRRSPSTADLPLLDKARESIALLRSHRRMVGHGQDFAWLFDDLASYDRLLRAHGCPPLRAASVLEIGYGARPYRLMALLRSGVDAEGLDAEVPILGGSAREFVAAYRRNGAERVLKSLARHVLFDRRERREFDAAMAARGLAGPIEPSRFQVADAAEFEPRRSYDLVFSEDVFEHIPRESLITLVPRMARWLRPDGLALIRPNVYTGITGGHALDWSRESFSRQAPRRTVAPWDHLRGARHRPNTFLNGLSRQDYRDLFATSFEILDEEVALPGLGREFLTATVARELAGWSGDELFSNQVRMVLRPRA